MVYISITLGELWEHYQYLPVRPYSDPAPEIAPGPELDPDPLKALAQIEKAIEGSYRAAQRTRPPGHYLPFILNDPDPVSREAEMRKHDAYATREAQKAQRRQRKAARRERRERKAARSERRAAPRQRRAARQAVNSDSATASTAPTCETVSI